MKMMVASSTVQRSKSTPLTTTNGNQYLYYKFIPPATGEMVISMDASAVSGGSIYVYMYSHSLSSPASANTSNAVDWRATEGQNYSGVGSSITLFNTSSTTTVNLSSTAYVTRNTPVYILISRLTTNGTVSNLKICYDVLEGS